MAFIALHWSISDGNESQFKVPEQHIVQNSWFCIVELSCMSVIDVFNPQACGTCLIRVRKKIFKSEENPYSPLLLPNLERENLFKFSFDGFALSSSMGIYLQKKSSFD